MSVETDVGPAGGDGQHSSDVYDCAQDGSGAGGRDRGRRAGMRELVKRWRGKRMPGWRKTSGRTYAMAEQG
jgi:hypothetical protein